MIFPLEACRERNTEPPHCLAMSSSSLVSSSINFLNNIPLNVQIVFSMRCLNPASHNVYVFIPELFHNTELDGIFLWHDPLFQCVTYSQDFPLFCTHEKQFLSKRTSDKR